MADILKKHNVQFDQGGLLWTMGLHTAGIDEVVKNRMADRVINQTQLVFLERGNANAGLLHAYQRHGADFASMCGIQSQNDISAYVQRIMGLGHYATYGFELGDRFLVVYQIDAGLFLRVAIGFNGFIVNAFPSNNQDREDRTEYELK